ncbi:peptidoglycan-binding protein, partial [Vibrio zhanjiangensis]|uniref:peptidoglycan-binding protein n=1 Tax=Vibrio zhanjiangensis TaxID=1046128 RepID=UPI0024E0FB93
WVLSKQINHLKSCPKIGGHFYSAPTKKYYSQPLSEPSTPSYTSPSTTTKTPKVNAADLAKRKDIIIRVQFALYNLGYYNGVIDGVMGKQTRSALEAYRKANNIPPSQTLDTTTLNSLGILAQ